MNFKEMAIEAAEIRNSIDRIKGENKISDPENGEVLVLSYLYKSEFEVHPKMIALEMQISTARVAKILSQLEAKGMIIRKDSEEDRRKIIVEILPEGREKYLRTKKEYYQRFERVLRELGKNDAQEYIRIQNRILEILQK